MASESPSFTPLAVQVIAKAVEEARRFNHGYVATEHILCGLLAVTAGGASQILTHAGATLPRFRSGIESIVGRGEIPPPHMIGFTPRSYKAVELAILEALKDGSMQVYTEYLLLGILLEGEGIAVALLQSFGISQVDLLSTTRSAISRRI